MEKLSCNTWLSVSDIQANKNKKPKKKKKIAIRNIRKVNNRRPDPKAICQYVLKKFASNLNENDMSVIWLLLEIKI